MSFKSWREGKRLSQERISEMTGLSLRTVQRLEAGHRVNYASLRALAATFQIDVDSLERELYAMNKASEDFVEIPRWVRFMRDERWLLRSRLSRNDVRFIEAFLIALAGILFVVSFMAKSAEVAKVMRVGAFIEFVCGYLVSLSIRTSDSYKLWQTTSQMQSVPTSWRSRIAELLTMLGIGVLGAGLMYWAIS